MEGNDRLLTSDAAPVACFYQNKVMFLLKIIFIHVEPLLSCLRHRRSKLYI